MGKLKQKLFNKMLEKPITDLTIVSFEIYYNSLLAFLDKDHILNYDEYCLLLKEKLERLYNGD